LGGITVAFALGSTRLIAPGEATGIFAGARAVGLLVLLLLGGGGDGDVVAEVGGVIGIVIDKELGLGPLFTGETGGSFADGMPILGFFTRLFPDRFP
jgi:hypothetical protein